MLETQMYSQFINFSKVLTLNHNILFDKLERYDVRGVILRWFKSYLHNRSQYVFYNGLQFAKLGIKCGVPQGSILGSILFLI